MRPQIVKKIVLTLCIHLLMYGYAIANEKGPPPPQPMNCPTCFPIGLPIDDGILILFLSGLVFGGYVIYRKKVSNQ
jgi:hypothetical protein